MGSTPVNARNALQPILTKWSKTCHSQVTRKLDDARSHAEKAVTDALRSTKDGRSSLLRINASPSYQAALARLDELLTALAGPSETSLVGLIRDARAAMYGGACEAHFASIPPKYRSRRTASPPDKHANEARAATPHGLDVRAELSPTFRRLETNLKAAIERSGRKLASREYAIGMIDQWHDIASRMLSKQVDGILGDSMIWCDYWAWSDLVHPDYVDNSPIEV